MSSFIGKAVVSVDQKFRTSLPLEFRKQWSDDLGSQVVVTLFTDNSLILRPLKEWEDYLESDLNLISKQNRQGSRFALRVTSMAKLSVLDGQNRILLSQELIQYAKIEKEVIFTGDGKGIRLWSPKAYDSMMHLSSEESVEFEQLFYKSYETN